MNRILSAFIFLISVATGFAAGKDPDTILLVDFDNTVKPVMHAPGVSAVIAENFTPEYVDGRFGKALRIHACDPKKIKGGLPVKYNTGKLMDQNLRGTIEFWCRFPFATGGSDVRSGRKVKVEFFRSGTPNTHVTMYKGIYNFLVFRYMRSFKNICNAAVPSRFLFREKDKWNHLAISWDENDARIFFNGKLTAVSREWEHIYFAKYIGLGLPSSQYVDYDDLRISRTKLYASSFNVNDKPLRETARTINHVQKPKPARKNCPANILFKYDNAKQSDFAVCSVGSPGILLNWNAGETEKNGGIKLTGNTNKIGRTLGFETKGNLNRHLGKVTIRFKLSPGFKLPFCLFDSSYYTVTGRTGMQLLVAKDEKLKWQYIHNNKPVSILTSEKLNLRAGDVTEIGFTWGGSSIELFRNGKKLAAADGLAMPPCLGNYTYICSAENGKDTCECRLLSYIVELPSQRPGGNYE